MKQTLLLVILIITSTCLFAQKKGEWIIGTDALFHSKTSPRIITDVAIYDVKVYDRDFSFTADVGYFVLNKLAVGLKPVYNINTTKSAMYSTSKAYFSGAGPFVRYYFLPIGRKFNFLLDGSYQIARSKIPLLINQVRSGNLRSNGHLASVSAGPVFFVSPKISLELLADYARFKFSDFRPYTGLRFENNLFMAGLGVQVVL